MVIAQILGGFGNQLSAYAWSYSLAKYLKQELVLDISDYTHKGYFRPYALDKLKIGSHRKLVYPPQSTGFMEVEGIPKSLRDRGLRIIRSDEVKTREELLEAVKGAKDIYLMGYGGMHFCTQEDQQEIKAQYQLKTSSTVLQQFQQRIAQEYSVAVHIRRTDFVTLGWKTSVEYFKAAITYIKIFHPDAHFYFFSDEIAYAKEQFGSAKNYHYVHILGGMDADLEEFFCISSCDSRILSKQSTFSWWASELNQKENKLDIAQETEGSKRSYPNRVYLNQCAIDTLCQQYETDPGVIESSFDVNNLAFYLVSEGRNEDAVKIIDQASLDSYGLTEENICELETFKGIALAQQTETGKSIAMRLFYEQMQRQSEDAAFHANYFRVLYQSGRILESAIHAGLANRFGDSEDYQEFFEAQQTASFVAAKELYQLLKDACPKQFIFIPIEGWSYYITYVKTLAVLLARMGQKVTLLQPTAIHISNGQGVSDTLLAKELIKLADSADSTYQFHLDLLPYPQGYSMEKTASLFHEIIQQIFVSSNSPTVVVASHPRVFDAPKVSGVAYVVPDICDALNREKLYFGNNLTNYLLHMSEYADAVYVSGTVPKSMKQHNSSKIRKAFSTWEDSEYQIVDMEMDFSSNYISSEQMIKNAVQLLKI